MIICFFFRTVTNCCLETTVFLVVGSKIRMGQCRIHLQDFPNFGGDRFENLLSKLAGADRKFEGQLRKNRHYEKLILSLKNHCSLLSIGLSHSKTF